MRDFRKLDFWKLGMEIVVDVYELIKKLPPHENYGLRSQMGKSSVSMPSNVAEGCSRTSNKEVARFLEISIGSAFELETQLLIGRKVGYFIKEDTTLIIPKLHFFQKSTNSYRVKLIS